MQHYIIHLIKIKYLILAMFYLKITNVEKLYKV